MVGPSYNPNDSGNNADQPIAGESVSALFQNFID